MTSRFLARAPEFVEMLRLRLRKNQESWWRGGKEIRVHFRIQDPTFNRVSLGNVLSLSVSPFHHP